jgi:prepilin-type N-terminal cleavage/methylation domain-containing protein
MDMSLSTGIQGKANSRGFTAIEITAVATIIAILAMLIIPLLRERVDETRLTAARSDLKELANVQMLARADTGFFFRLQDLDNTAEFNPDLRGVDDQKLDIFLPHATWNEEFVRDGNGAQVQRQLMASGEKWKGPYISFNNSQTQAEMVALFPELFWGAQPPGLPVIEGGPIFITSYDFYTGGGVTVAAAEKDRMPLDPWGNPYIFFAPERIFDSTQPLPAGVDVPPIISSTAGPASETDYKSAVIYSLGPDGLPGNMRPRTPPFDLFRDSLMGETNDPDSDDLEIIF